jgi:hypothetical protein
MTLELNAEVVFKRGYIQIQYPTEAGEVFTLELPLDKELESLKEDDKVKVKIEVAKDEA